MNIRQHLLEGQVVPAHPLALTAGLRLDERHQRALTRYYVESGAGGIAVGVHTTQFAIREAGLYRPVLELAMEASREWLARVAVEGVAPPFARIAGVVGDTPQAVGEAEVARALGYDLALASLGGLSHLDDRALVAHCRAIGEVLPVFGFYLQPAVGGRPLSYAFWRELAEMDRLWAVKVAPFNRYQTLDVVRAMAEAGRDDVALYTGNDDAIVADLVTPVPVRGGSAQGTRHFAGGLLGQWAVWTSHAVALLARARSARMAGSVSAALLAEGAALTEANAAIFDAAHGFAGCIPGIHEVLRRQGLLAGTWTLDPRELLSPGQLDEIDRVLARYPELADDAFVAERLDAWLA